MKKCFVGLVVFFSVLSSCLVVLNCEEKSAGSPKKEVLKTQKDKVSYAIGRDIGTNLKKQALDINPDILSIGIKDSLTGATGLLTDQEMKEAIAFLRQEMMAKQEAANMKNSGKNKKEGEEFLAKNKNNKGVKTLPSGLQYKVITEGTGEKPKETDTVTVNYKGTLINGTEFDSSYKRGQPASFPVNGVIKGWTEALQLMKVGSKWELYIPSNLAYGERGAGGDIGPDSTLIFTVELISIKK